MEPELGVALVVVLVAQQHGLLLEEELPELVAGIGVADDDAGVPCFQTAFQNAVG